MQVDFYATALALAEAGVAASAAEVMQMPFGEYLKWCSQAAAQAEAREKALKRK